MYEVLYLIKTLIYLALLIVIKFWTFGGFGLDKTYVLLFFTSLSLSLPLIVDIFGFFSPNGGRILLHLSVLRYFIYHHL